MKIYVSHSKTFDYENELYIPLRKSLLNDKYEIILPHENSLEQMNSKTFMKNSCDLVIAEVSHRATGLGIELGWADSYNVPIICIYKKGTKVAGSVKVLNCSFIEYNNSNELIQKLIEKISEIFGK